MSGSSKRLMLRLSLASLSILLSGLIGLHFVVEAQNKPPARRPLPKPAQGARGFEQSAGRDASSRLISGGATREVTSFRKPVAPMLGLAYEARPFFKWGPAFGTKSYHFTLYDGDVNSTTSVPVVFEIDTNATQLVYPKDAPALQPGRLYSWRVLTETEGKKELGPAVTFFILSGPDAAEVKAALEKGKLTAPTNAADRLRQAKVFEEYGVWYDALRITDELAAQNASDAAAQAYYDSLLDKLEGK